MDNEFVYFAVMLVAVLLGIVFTVIYYFARYYIKTHDQDEEVVANLKSKSHRTLKEALAKTRTGFWGQFEQITQITDAELDRIEEMLYTSDVGPQMATKIFDTIGEKFKSGKIQNSSGVRDIIRSEIESTLTRLHTPELWHISHRPTVWMIVGVNGVGKTTTIGKLASQAKSRGLKVLVAAGDTFRAAADLQLEKWAEKAGVEIFKSTQTKDPSAVAYAALEHAKSHQFDLVLLDTAGRLHTDDHLVEELKKTKRVMSKVITTAPDQVLLVVDGNSGQNALNQGRIFHSQLGLTGLAVTKLDGTSKGGVVIGLVSELSVPVHFIGIGESVEDLRPFNAKDFVESII